MKQFSKEEISKWKSMFTSRSHKEQTTTLGESEVRYFVLPKKFFPRLDGMIRMIGTPETNYLIAVCEEVPELIRPHFAVSEHDSFRVYGLEDGNRHLRSEENILRIFGENSPLRNGYVRSRLKLYSDILKSPTGDLVKSGFNEEDLEGIDRARQFLEAQSKLKYKGY